MYAFIADGGGVVHAAVATIGVALQAACGGAWAGQGDPHGRFAEGHPPHSALLCSTLPAHGGGKLPWESPADWC